MNRKPDLKTLLQLFLSMLYISAFTFGGGFVIVTLMKKKFVDGYHWMDENEMLDYTALAQSSPGAIAVNAAILVGWRVGGPLGMIAGVIGTILPPMVILSVISLFYAAFSANVFVAALLKGMRAGVAAVIADVVWDMAAKLLRKKQGFSLPVMAAAFAATWFWNVNVIFIILGAAAVGICAELVRHRKEGAA